MHLRALYTALVSHIDVPFNAWLSAILTVTYVLAIRKPSLLLLVVIGTSVTILIFDKTSNSGELVKITALLPLGLGSVLTFLTAGQALKIRLLPYFETYVNLAVYGNILMMLGTPAGGTLRGLCSKITGAALFVWIVRQGQQVKWKTIRIHDRTFVFTAVSKSWVFAHAVYRFILLTLPCFEHGRRHRLLELYSLGLTHVLASTTGLPFEFCFGMADTTVVPVVAGWSAISRTFDLISHDSSHARSPERSLSPTRDRCLSFILLSIAIFACFKIARVPRGAE